MDRYDVLVAIKDEGFCGHLAVYEYTKGNYFKGRARKTLIDRFSNRAFLSSAIESDDIFSDNCIKRLDSSMGEIIDEIIEDGFDFFSFKGVEYIRVNN